MESSRGLSRPSYLRARAYRETSREVSAGVLVVQMPPRHRRPARAEGRPAMIAAIYARKSTPQEGATGTSDSVDRQIEHARAYAEAKGWTAPPEHVYFDDNVSGAAWARLERRNQMVEACEAGAPFQVLVVSEQSRLGRHMIETAHLIMRIADSGVRIFSYLDDCELKVEDEVDQAMTVLKSFAAAVERRQGSRRVFDSAIRRVRAGQIAGARIYGYDNVPVPGPGGKRLHTLRAVNAEQAAVVRRIFARYADGIGSLLLARELNAQRIASPRPTGWHQTGIRAMLRNPLYRGEVVWGKVKGVVRKGRKRHEARPEAEWIRLEAPELRIVSEDLWQRVQAIREAKRRTLPRGAAGRLLGRPTWRDGHSDYLLPGFLSCSICGGQVRTVTLKYGRSPKRYPVRFYGCAQHENRGQAVCANDVRLRHEILDHAILKAIGELLDERIVDAAVDRAIEQLRAGEASYLDRRTEIERELSLLRHRIDRAMNTYLDGSGAMEDVKRRLQDDAARRDVLVAELATWERLGDTASLDAERLKREVRARAADVRALLGRHVPQARQMLRKLLAAPIRLEPVTIEARRGYRFDGQLTFERVLGGLALPNPGGHNRLRLIREFEIRVPPGSLPARRAAPEGPPAAGPAPAQTR
ncbi:MAG TPA: recombinase family protein [Candidatus Limnocylindria bacterium]|nr:recombinase family protein [Candidatus Limnocylindria bacterium]